MKICFLTTSAPRYNDDNRSPFIWELIQAIKQQGHDISMVAMHQPGANENELSDGINIHRVRYASDEHEGLSKTRAGIPAAWSENKLKTLFSLLKLITRMSTFLKEQGRYFDVIHANWTIAGLAAVLSKRIHHRPIVLTLHGSDIFGIKNKKVIRYVTQWVLNNVDRIIGVSSPLKDEIESMGIPQNKITVIPNGTTFEILPRGDDFDQTKNVLFVGSLVDQKRPLDLLIAFAQISTKNPRSTLEYIGEGPWSQKLLASIDGFNLTSRVKLIGTVPHSEVASAMLRSSIFVLPSINEGFGVVLLEAIACGLPCVAYNSGGVIDILGHGNGLLAIPEDTDSLSQCLDVLLNNKEIYYKLRSNGYKQLSNFTWPVVAKKVLKVYKELKDQIGQT